MTTGYKIVSEALRYKKQSDEKMLGKFRGSVIIYVKKKQAFKKWLTARIRVSNLQLYLDSLSSFLVVPLPPYIWFNWTPRKDIPVPYHLIEEYKAKDKELHIQLKDDVIVVIKSSSKNIDKVKGILDKYAS
jgi:hypothetical protein